MNDRLWKRIERVTPYKVIKMVEYEIRLFDLGTSDLVMVFKDNRFFWHCKTCGYGYNYEIFCLDRAFRHIGIQPKSNQNLYSYHKGGNFYLVPKKEVRRYV